MIPIRDTTPSKNVPIVNNILIAVNVAVFIIQLTQGYNLNRFVYIYGLVPGRYTLPDLAVHFSLFQQICSWVSFMFLHGGFIHLLGNMWSLYIFGDNIEDRLGPLRYLIFYLLCGIASGASHFIVNSQSQAPVIGASGAVAGVMGAYFLLYPTSKILTLIPIIFIPLFFEIPAVFFLGFWFFLQFINAAGNLGATGSVAWWAHVGGFIFGILFLKLLNTVPTTGLSTQLRKITLKRRTHPFQLVKPDKTAQSADIYATLTISPYEALVGARKLVTISYGFQRRAFRVNVPPGVFEGKVLRLKGQGRTMIAGVRGDLLIKVHIR
ncbi:MAG: rhomboid family intramembrane serine protease [Desulfobacteraceae bacterium]|nr:rhomboid family intramembrane serine protease [Desulfobacteraceae bacterium]